MIVYEMILTYAITGTKDLCTLLAYLTKVIDPEDEIVCFNEIFDMEVGTITLLDSYLQVKKVWKNDVRYDKCIGQYIFCVHSTEIPDQRLIKNIKSYLYYHKPEIVSIPRINIMHGYTEDDLKEHNYKIDENTGWVNWPDYYDRIFLRDTRSLYPNRFLLFPEKKNSITCVIHARTLR